MTVRDAIEKLMEMPLDAELWISASYVVEKAVKIELAKGYLETNSMPKNGLDVEISCDDEVFCGY